MLFPRQHENRLVEPFNQLRLNRILSMIIPHLNGKALDLGCANGSISHFLSQSCQTVGVDIERAWLRRNRKSNRLDYVVGDINALPFAGDSVDVVICASVLEHMAKLETALEDVSSVVKQNGVLIVGYPVEAFLFKLVWRILCPHEFKRIDQAHPENVKDYWNIPGSHKQSYLTIRKAIGKHFKICRRIKLPFSFLPDLLSYYECLQLSKD